MLWQHYLKLSCQQPDADATEDICKVANHCKVINSTIAGKPSHIVNWSDKQNYVIFSFSSSTLVVIVPWGS